MFGAVPDATGRSKISNAGKLLDSCIIAGRLIGRNCGFTFSEEGDQLSYQVLEESSEEARSEDDLPDEYDLDDSFLVAEDHEIEDTSSHSDQDSDTAESDHSEEIVENVQLPRQIVLSSDDSDTDMTSSSGPNSDTSWSDESGSGDRLRRDAPANRSQGLARVQTSHQSVFWSDDSAPSEQSSKETSALSRHSSARAQTTRDRTCRAEASAPGSRSREVGTSNRAPQKRRMFIEDDSDDQ